MINKKIDEFPDTAGYPDGMGFLDEGTATPDPDGSASGDGDNL